MNTPFDWSTWNPKIRENIPYSFCARLRKSKPPETKRKHLPLKPE